MHAAGVELEAWLDRWVTPESAESSCERPHDAPPHSQHTIERAHEERFRSALLQRRRDRQRSAAQNPSVGDAAPRLETRPFAPHVAKEPQEPPLATHPLVRCAGE